MSTIKGLNTLLCQLAYLVGDLFPMDSRSLASREASSALLCAATFISRATPEPARGTFHRPAGGRPLSTARLHPAIPDRRAFPRVAHPRAESPVFGKAAPQPCAAPGSQPDAPRGSRSTPRCADLRGSPRGARILQAR